MPKTATTVNKQTATNDDARQVSYIASTPEEREAVQTVIRELSAREQRYERARRVWNQPDSMAELGRRVTELYTDIFTRFDDAKQGEAAYHCETVLFPALEHGMHVEQEYASDTPEYGAAKAAVLSALAGLVTRAPRSVRGEPLLTAKLQGYMSIFSGMRGVALDIQHSTVPSDKLAAIRAAQAKREQRQAETLSKLRSMLPAPVVDAD